MHVFLVAAAALSGLLILVISLGMSIHVSRSRRVRLSSSKFAAWNELQPNEPAEHMATSSMTRPLPIVGRGSMTPPPGSIQPSRIAVLLPCYNMKEAALHLITELSKRCGDLFIDIYLVDNGSDPEFQFTSLELPTTQHVKTFLLRLPINVQTTHAFNAAMTLARGVTYNHRFQYEAYWLWITSQAIPPQSPLCPCDIATPLLMALRNNSTIGAIVPSLRPYERNIRATHVKNMLYNPRAKQQADPPLTIARNTDLLGLMIRGDLFARMTLSHFDPTILRAWGLDLDICATVRAAGYQVAVHHGIVLEKQNNIGYKKQRMSETLQQRQAIAFQEMKAFLHDKYGTLQV